jgi:pimeloyl-ACP methyl ester carboxylesterase
MALNKLHSFKNVLLEGTGGKPMVADIYYRENRIQKPILIFSHGFKGFKDWGGFNQAAEYFVRQDFVFVKFNFSHNGTTPADPSSFDDLEAFGENTFSKELEDLDIIIDWAQTTDLVADTQRNIDEIYLVGHSRGGGITILKAAQDNRVKKLVTWSSVNDFGYAWNDDLVAEWKVKGVQYANNARTNQRMPLNYSLYEDYQANHDKLNIPAAVSILKKPFMVIHGTEDETVPLEQALDMKRWNSGIKLELIPNGTHTFGVKHPHTAPHLPFDMLVVVERTAEFLKKK